MILNVQQRQVEPDATVLEFRAVCSWATTWGPPSA